MSNPYPTDALRDSFLSFLKQGMTYAEALEQFDETEFWHASMAEVFANEAGRDLFTPGWTTRDDRKLPALFELLIRAQRERSDERDMELAIELWAAGWTSEVPECYRHNSTDFWRQCPTMSLYWRAPSRRPPRPGRRYLSTSQAYNAMKKAKA